MTSAQEKKTWFQNLEKVKQYIRTHGKYPSNHKPIDENERMLAGWLYQTRSKFRRNVLSKEKYKAFQESGLIYREADILWDKYITSIKAFLAKYGRLPQSRKNRQEKKMVCWLYYQKQQMKKGLLTPQKKETFQQMIAVPDQKDLIWRNTLKLAIQFLKKHGKRPRILAENADERRLGTWLQRQRLQSKKQMPRSRKSLLLASRLLEVSEKDVAWDKNYQKLVAYCSKYRRLPRKKAADSKEELNLHIWFYNQQRNIRGKTLSPEKTLLLKQIRAKVTLREQTNSRKWKGSLNEVKLFITKHNRLPGHGKKGTVEVRLSNWLFKQKKAYRKGKLDSNHKIQLKLLGHELADLESWSQRGVEKAAQLWLTKYNDTKRFIHEKGHRPKFTEDPSLAHWWKSQYTRILSKKMTDKQLSLLIEIGFDPGQYSGNG